jgi:hypothetical protein
MGSMITNVSQLARAILQYADILPSGRDGSWQDSEIDEARERSPMFKLMVCWCVWVVHEDLLTICLSSGQSKGWRPRRR